MRPEYKAHGLDTVAVPDPGRVILADAVLDRARTPGADQARFLDQFAADVVPLVQSNNGLADFAPLSVSKYAQ